MHTEKQVKEPTGRVLQQTEKGGVQQVWLKDNRKNAVVQKKSLANQAERHDNLMQLKAWIAQRPLGTFKKGSLVNKLATGIGHLWNNSYETPGCLPMHWCFEFEDKKTLPGVINEGECVGIDKFGYLVEHKNSEFTRVREVSSDLSTGLNNSSNDAILFNIICSNPPSDYNIFTNNCQHWVGKIENKYMEEIGEISKWDLNQSAGVMNLIKKDTDSRKSTIKESEIMMGDCIFP